MSNIEAVKKYQEKRDSIMLRPSKEDGQTIRNAAKEAGQSVQAYIIQAVHDRMEREHGEPDRRLETGGGVLVSPGTSES